MSRAALWDDECDRKARAVQDEERRKMAERHAKHALAFQEKAVERLALIDMNALSPNAALRYFVEAVKVERQARGDPAEVQESCHTGDPERPVSVETKVAGKLTLDLDSLPLEVLRKLRDLRNELAGVPPAGPGSVLAEPGGGDGP